MKKINDNESAIELIIDEFESNLSEEGKIELQRWVHSNPENEKLYKEFQNLNNDLDVLSVYKHLDPVSSWDVLEKKIGHLSVMETHPAVRMYRRPRIWWMSAAAILICSVGIIAYQMISAPDMTLRTLANQHIQYRLPDGSSITMNGNTVIKYNESKFQKSRELTLLKGEAFFDVVHDPGKIFQIAVGDLRVTDIGTSFVIKKSESEITVMVSSGKVAFQDLSSNNKVILGAGEKGVFMTGTKAITTASNDDVNYKSWIDKKLIFKNALLPVVVKELEETYGSKIILKDNVLKKRMLTATLNYQTIDSALVVIAASLQLKVEKQADHYELTAGK
jgi:transmembrane sensor